MTTASALSEAVKSNFLDSSGGTMSGNVKFNQGKCIDFEDSTGYTRAAKVDKNAFFIENWFDKDGTNTISSRLVLRNHNHSSLAGRFELDANDGTNKNSLVGYPNGSLTWGGKGVITSAGGTFTGIINSTVNNSISVSRSEGDAFVASATRTDTGHSVRFGVGAGGVNRGIYDNKSNRWMIYYDTNNTLKTGVGTVAVITASWRSGENWYRKYSDGFIEQGGIASYSNSSGTTITYHTAYASNNPTVSLNVTTNNHGEFNLSSVTKTNFKWICNATRTGYIYWQASGY